jgi:putative ABC transport system substrate-binding protein
MRRRTLGPRAALLPVLAFLAAPLVSEGQQSKAIPRLCFLTFDPGTLQTRSPRFDGFFHGLQDLGYVDGRNIRISYLSADNNGDRFPALIQECLSLKPDVIAVTTTPAARLLKRATRTVPTVMFIVHRARVTELAARHKLPVVYPFLLPVTDANGLMAYTAKASEVHRNAAAYVDRILKGARVADLPVQQPTRFELVINLKAAKALGLAIPPTLLSRATEVIE